MTTAPDGSGTSISSGISLHQFLQRIRAKGSNPEWQGHCPCHDDKQASLHVTLSGEKVLLKCHATCNDQNLFIQRLKDQNLWPIKVTEEEIRIAAAQSDSSVDYTRERTLENLFITDEKPPRPKTPDGYQYVDTHAYRTRQGHLFGTIVRFEELRPPDTPGKPTKKFIPTFYFKIDGIDQWLHKNIALRQFYNLPSLNKSGPVIIVEGEKTCDAAVHVFPNQPILSPNGGLQGFSRSDLSPLQGRSVVIWPDADLAWKENAENWAKLLISISQSIKIVHLTKLIVDTYPKWDLADPIPNYPVLVQELYKNARPFEQNANTAISCITKAEDLRQFYVKVFVKLVTHYIHVTTGQVFTPSQFDEHFRIFTKPRFGIQPSQYLIDGPGKLERTFIEYAYEPGQPRHFTDKEKQIVSYNKWSNTNIWPVPGSVMLFLEHINWLFTPEDGVELLRRLANLVQNPRNRPTSAFLIQGKQGLGKSILFDSFGALVGWSNFVIIEPDLILSGFNQLFAYKTMVIMNEFSDFSRREFMSHIKGFIADSTMTVSEKYVPAYRISNYSHIFAITNQDRPVNLTTDDRRFYIAKCVPTKPKLASYYNRLATWFRENPEALLDYLLDYKLDDWNAKAIPPLNKAKIDVIARSQLKWMGDLEVLVKEKELRYNIFKEGEFYKTLEIRGLKFTSRQDVRDFLYEVFGTQTFDDLTYPYPYKGKTLWKKAAFIVLEPGIYESKEIEVVDLYLQEREANKSDPPEELL
jgi:hypothetical protein